MVRPARPSKRRRNPAQGQTKQRPLAQLAERPTENREALVRPQERRQAEHLTSREGGLRRPLANILVNWLKTKRDGSATDKCASRSAENFNCAGVK